MFGPGFRHLMNQRNVSARRRIAHRNIEEERRTSNPLTLHHSSITGAILPKGARALSYAGRGKNRKLSPEEEALLALPSVRLPK